MQDNTIQKITYFFVQYFCRILILKLANSIIDNKFESGVEFTRFAPDRRGANPHRRLSGGI